MRYKCAHVPEDNGISERCHCTVKRIAANMQCSIQEVVYWYITSKDDETPLSVPANGMYQYEQHMKGLDSKLSSLGGESNPYQVGELVWVKTPSSRCTTQFSKGCVNSD